MRGLKENIVIKDETVIVRKAGMDTTDLDGEKVMMDLDKGEYFMINEVGGRIWDIIQQPISFKAIINILLNEYDIEENICRESVITFIERLEEMELANME